MITYKIVVTLNDWNKYGEPCNIRTSTVHTTTDPVEAGKALTAHGVPFRSKDHSNMTVQAGGSSGFKQVDHIDLYAAVVGPQVFGAQLADENFSINLDDFFRSL